MGNKRIEARKKPLFTGHLDDFGPLSALDENLDVAIGQLDALHDVRKGTDLINFFGFRIVNGGVMLCDQEDFLVAGERFFERAEQRLPGPR